MSILGTLFSSEAIIKIMRLFLLNPDTPFENTDIAERSKVSAQTLRTELSILSRIGFIKKKAFTRELPPRTKNGNPRKKKTQGWVLNSEFPYLYSLKLLLLSSDAVDRREMKKRIDTAGRVKLIVLSGAFLRDNSSRIDMLVVGDKLDKKKLEKALKHIEAEVGKELEYAAMDTKEFSYRLGMYDKFIRDILDYPHEKVVDKIGL